MRSSGPRRWWRAALAIAAVAAAPSAAAPPEPGDQITVTANRLRPEELRDRADSFVRSVGVLNGEATLARWVEPVCPKALNLAPQYAALVEAKLRAIAAAARIPVARVPCRANIAVSFVPDGGALVRQIATRSFIPFARMPAVTRTALLDGNAPIRWWYATGREQKDGGPTSRSPPPILAGNGQGGGSVLPTLDGGSSKSYGDSLLSTATVRVLTGATVVVDITRTEGLPLDTVVAYAAMVSFAEIRAAEFAPPYSILGLFEPGSSARKLSNWDSAFLTALYRIPHARAGRQQRGLLVREMVAALPDR